MVLHFAPLMVLSKCPGEYEVSHYEPDKVQQISILCNVSASEDYLGKASGEQFTFKGIVMFGDVIVYPYEQP